jgi:hypothetical protein
MGRETGVRGKKEDVHEEYGYGSVDCGTKWRMWHG